MFHLWIMYYNWLKKNIHFQSNRACLVLNAEFTFFLQKTFHHWVLVPDMVHTSCKEWHTFSKFENEQNFVFLERCEYQRILKDDTSTFLNMRKYDQDVMHMESDFIACVESLCSPLRTYGPLTELKFLRWKLRTGELAFIAFLPGIALKKWTSTGGGGRCLKKAVRGAWLSHLCTV